MSIAIRRNRGGREHSDAKSDGDVLAAHVRGPTAVLQSLAGTALGRAVERSRYPGMDTAEHFRASVAVAAQAAKGFCSFWVEEAISGIIAALSAASTITIVASILPSNEYSSRQGVEDQNVTWAG